MHPGRFAWIPVSAWTLFAKHERAVVGLRGFLFHRLGRYFEPPRPTGAVRCIGHRSALHSLLQRAALGFAAHCVCLLSLLGLSLHPLSVGLPASSGCSLGAVACLFYCGRASPAVSFLASIIQEKSGRCYVAECGQRQLPVPVTVFCFMRKKCSLTCETRKKLYLCKSINVA